MKGDEILLAEYKRLAVQLVKATAGIVTLLLTIHVVIITFFDSSELRDQTQEDIATADTLMKDLTCIEKKIGEIQEQCDRSWHVFEHDVRGHKTYYIVVPVVTQNDSIWSVP
jgi:hypothetical protein